MNRLLFLMILLLLPSIALAGPPPKAEELELVVSLNDKKVGSEVLRTQSGQEGRHDSIEANLQDKVQKVWKQFQQRATLERETDGTVKSYRRAIYVKGATILTNLFNYNGGWRVGAQADAGSKPKVTDVKVKMPFVVLDERAVSLVVIAAEQLARHGDADYVRVDNATYGRLALTTETLTADGKQWTRLHLRDGKAMHLEVLKNSAGHVVQIKGLDGWSGLAAGQKVPAHLESVTAETTKPAELPQTPTPTHKPVTPPKPRQVLP